MIVVADAGPLLHLHWVDAAGWALPPVDILVVDAVWQEVTAYAPDALRDTRLQRVQGPVDVPAVLSTWKLDDGEIAALALALSQRDRDEVLVLCDERMARRACSTLQLGVTGSIGLIIEAHRADRVSAATAIQTLRELPQRGRLRVDSSLIDRAIAAVGAGRYAGMR